MFFFFFRFPHFVSPRLTSRHFLFFDPLPATLFPPREFDWPSCSKEVVSALTSISSDVRSVPYDARSSCSFVFLLLLLVQSFSAQVSSDSLNSIVSVSLFPSLSAQAQLFQPSLTLAIVSFFPHIYLMCGQFA